MVNPENWRAYGLKEVLNIITIKKETSLAWRVVKMGEPKVTEEEASTVCHCG